MSQEGVLNSSGGGGGTGMPIQTITGNVGGPVGPDGVNNFNLIANTTMGITTIGTAALNQINILALPSTTSQIGTIQLATNAEAIAGTDTAKAITADDLKAKLGTQTQFALPIGAGNSSAISWTAAPTDGQILIGSTGLTPVLNTITAGTGIGISNGAGTITISNTGGSALTYTNVNTTPYVVLPADQYLGVDCSGGAITIQLPNAPTTGRVFVIKDRTGSSLGNPITVTTVGGVVNIDGNPTYTMNSAFQAISLIFDGTTYQVY
jgi:hypothetical protein